MFLLRAGEDNNYFFEEFIIFFARFCGKIDLEVTLILLLGLRSAQTEILKTIRSFLKCEITAINYKKNNSIAVSHGVGLHSDFTNIVVIDFHAHYLLIIIIHVK